MFILQDAKGAEIRFAGTNLDIDGSNTSAEDIAVVWSGECAGSEPIAKGCQCDILWAPFQFETRDSHEIQTP